MLADKFRATSRNKRSDVQTILTGALATCVSSFLIYLLPLDSKLLVFGISYWIIAILAIRQLFCGKPIDPFSPSVISFALLFLYGFASALNANANGKTIYGDLVDIDSFDKYYVSCLVGCLGLAIGFILSCRYQPRLPAPRFIQANLDDGVFHRKCWIWISIIGLALATFLRKGFDFTSVQSYADTALISRVLYMELGADQGLKEYFTYLAPLTLMIVLGILLTFRAKPSVKIIGIAILGTHFLTIFLGGSRNSIAFLACILLVFVNYRVKKIGLPVVVFLAIAGVVMVNVVSILRVTNDPAKMLDTAIELAQSDNEKALNISNSGELLTGQNLFRLIKGIDKGETEYTYGGSVATEFLVFIPKGFLEGRPLTLAEKYVDTFYPGVLESGGGYGFFYIMEGYWAFGLVGVIVMMSLYGWLINSFYYWCMKYVHSDFVALLYGISLYPLAMYSVRSGLLISVKTMLMDIAPLVIVGMLPMIWPARSNKA